MMRLFLSGQLLQKQPESCHVLLVAFSANDNPVTAEIPRRRRSSNGTRRACSPKTVAYRGVRHAAVYLGFSQRKACKNHLK